MTFELGRAEFIIDVDNDEALRESAQYFAEVRKQAQATTKELAKDLQVRQSDVRKGATVVINEAKKETAERLREDKRLADQRKRLLIDTIKNEVAELKSADRARKERATAIIREEKAIERERLESVRRTVREEAAIRARGNAQRIQQERTQQRQQAAASRTGPQAEFGRVVRGIPGDIATIAGFGAIASGAILIRAALQTLTEATLKQQQAQRSLNAAFGQTQILFKQNADDLAKQFNRVSSEVEQATARFGTLNQQTVLTGAQIRELQKGAIDLQSAFGGDLEEVFRSTAGAVLGETEAFEKFGLVLQEGVLKSSPLLTEEERKRFTVMSESEKQLIRYRLIMQHLVTVQGQATQRAKEAQGGFDALTRSVDELAKALGKDLVEATGGFAKTLSEMINGINKFIEAKNILREAQQLVEADRRAQEDRGETPDFFEGFGPFSQSGRDRIDRERAGIIDRQRRLAAIKEQNAREKEALDDAEKARIAARDREEAALKESRKRIEATLKEAHDKEIKRINERIKAAEFERQKQLDVLDVVKEAELHRLEDTENARRRAADLELARIEKEKDTALNAIEERRDADIERINVSREAARNAAEAQIQQLQNEQKRLKGEADDRRDSTLEQLERQQEAEQAALKDQQDAVKRARIVEDRIIEDSLKKQDRQLEDHHQKTLRRIEREEEALQDKYDKELRNIDSAGDKEDKRHDKRMRQIDDEADRQLQAIDDQIEAINRSERELDAARRRRENQQKLSDAQLRLRQATGSQDPNARIAAQGKLVAALRIGDPEAVRKAQTELAEIVGQGTRAIEEAQRDLGNVQEDIRDDDVKSANDAQREKLENEKERIQATKELERREEEDRNKRRKDRLEADKRAEKERFDDAKKNLERKREREEDANKDAKREIEDLTETNKRNLDDRRRAEDESFEHAAKASKDRYELETEATRKRYETEIEQIEETYNGENGYIPNIRRALDVTNETYRQEEVAIRNRYKDEQEQIRLTYDDPETGLIAQQRRAEEDARHVYSRLVATTTSAYEAARKAVERAYVAGDGKSGIIDKLNVLKTETDEKLSATLLSFEHTKEELVGANGVITTQWADAVRMANEYFDNIEKRNKRLEQEAQQRSRRPSVAPGGIQVGPDPGMPGSTTPDFGPGGERGGPGAPPPAPTPPTQPGQNPTPPQKVPQFNQYDFEGLNFAEIDAACGPAALRWFGQMIGKTLDGRTAVRAAQRAGWDTELGMHGPNAFSNALASIGVKNHVLWSPSKKLIDELAQSQIPFAISTGKHYFQVQGGSSGALNVGGSGRALRNGSSIMSYEEIASALGADGIQAVVIPNEGAIPGYTGYNPRDSGYMFRNPTMYMDMRTGERGVVAERGPEILLGRKDTQQFEQMGLSRTLNRPATMTPNYDIIGQNMSSVHPYTSVSEGDKFYYNGTAPDNIFRQWRDDQRRQKVLRGV